MDYLYRGMPVEYDELKLPSGRAVIEVRYYKSLGDLHELTDGLDTKNTSLLMPYALYMKFIADCQSIHKDRVIYEKTVA